MPLCFGASGSVRARHTPQCARCAARRPHLLPGELPATLGANGLRAQRRKVGARARLAEQLAPEQLAAQRGRHEPLDLLGVPCSRIVGAAHQPIDQIRPLPRPPPPVSWSISSCSAGAARGRRARGQCGASSPVSASAACRFSAGSAATSATAAAISGCRCRAPSRGRRAGRGARRPGSVPRRAAASATGRRGTARCRRRGADRGARRAPR